MEVTYVLMAIIGLVTYIAWQKPALHSKLMLNPYAVMQQKQYYRLLTSGFVHNNSVHLFLNLLTLYFFGLAINDEFNYAFHNVGAPLYIIFFVTAIVIANIPTTLKYKEQPHYNSLGASGGVSALVLAFVLFDPLKKLYFFGLFPLPGYALGALFIGYSVIMSKRNVDNINHDAHLFGAIYGVAFILLIRPQTLRTFLEALLGA